jgi:uncharacterized membrane protein
MAYLVHKVVLLLVTLLKPAANLLPPGHWFGVAAIDVAALVLLMLALLGMGVFSRSKAGRRVAETLEQMVLSKVPGYLMIKSIAADFSSGEHDEGFQPVLVSFDDNQVLGFMIERDDASDRVTVFLPGSPSPAGGDVVVVPGARVQLLDASLGLSRRAMKQRGRGLLQLTMVPVPISRSASGPL